ncbi:YciK family oxidoreductase [Pelagibaculum spongiae]|uniref:YciK family oxidoreductase n=1 Tax=Pelagibaculum spongiae TaxID=2080658 RepID=A0A2V1GZZ4_9GAMM|nr:YciK family oxidoreductase [Pelagibaculum spongiae]PVZ72571.1 YciK family oxidoreductase [Pelagibaculum spongiae]
MFTYDAKEKLFQDKVILVTGAGAGIGKAAALNLAKLGATIVLLGRTTQKLSDVYDAIEAAGGPQAAIIPMNLESAGPKDFQDLADAIENEFGKLDGILHNASILGSLTPLANFDPQKWLNVMQVNVNSAFLMTQHLLPSLKKADNASILFTSSSVGRKGRAYWGAYSVSKFATEGLMQVLADELDENTNVRANCINPGATRTSMRANAYPGENPNTLATPDDIMPAYLYLLGDDSIGVNGKTFDAQKPNDQQPE